jgi:hypothetical protein
VLCVLFVASFLLSSAYLVFHAGHSHDRSAPGGSCATCAHMAAAASFGKLLSLAVVGTFIAFRPLSAVPAPLPALLSRTVRTSPVRLKVRLDY